MYVCIVMISKPFTGYADHGISRKRRSTQSLDQVQVELKYMHLKFCRINLCSSCKSTSYCESFVRQNLGIDAMFYYGLLLSNHNRICRA